MDNTPLTRNQWATRNSLSLPTFEKLQTFKNHLIDTRIRKNLLWFFFIVVRSGHHTKKNLIKIL